MSHFFDELESQLQAAAKQAAASGAPARPWWRRRRNAALIAVVVAGAATPALAKVTGIWNPGVSPQPPEQTVTAGVGGGFSCSVPGGPLGPSITDAPPSSKLTAILAVLRRPRKPSDRFAGVSRSGLAVRAVNLRAIRYLGSAGGERFFAVPNLGPRPRPRLPARCLKRLPAAERRRAEESRRRSPTVPTVCLVSAHSTLGCPSAHTIQTMGAWGIVAGSGQRSEVVGLVPDGVDAVTVRYGNSARTFGVNDNFFAYAVAVEADRFPDAIVWHRADGSAREVAPPGPPQHRDEPSPHR